MKKRNLLLIVGSIVILGGIVLFMFHIPQRVVDDVLYDNYDHYLPCSSLPKKAEVEQVVRDHAAVVDRIRAVSADVEFQIDTEKCPGQDRADLIVSYPGHSQRLEIEQILGGKTFFGIPTRWRNW